MVIPCSFFCFVDGNSLSFHQKYTKPLIWICFSGTSPMTLMRVFLTCTERLFECVFWLHSLNFQMQLWSFDLLHLWWNIKEIGHIGLEITEVNCQQVLIWVNAYTELFWATIQKTVSQSLTFKEFFHMSKFGWSEMFSFFKTQFSVDYRSNRSKSKANHLLLFLIWIMVPFDQEDQRLYSEVEPRHPLWELHSHQTFDFIQLVPTAQGHRWW